MSTCSASSKGSRHDAGVWPPTEGVTRADGIADVQRARASEARRPLLQFRWRHQIARLVGERSDVSHRLASGDAPMLRRKMRVPLLRVATTDARVVLLPIRCAVTARLKGFEVVSSMRESAGKSSLRRDAAKYSPAAAHQLAQVLSGDVASLISGHGLKLWIPLSLNALQQNDFAFVLSDGLSAPALAGIDFTLELVASDILACTLSANRHVLAELARQDACIAVSGSESSGLASIEAVLLAGVRISEVRLPATLCRRPTRSGLQACADENWLAETVASFHERGLLVSALDVSDTRRCHEIIVAGFDLIQGDLVGGPHSVEATVEEMVAALPFGRTLL